MLTTIDSAGRLVVPKPIRERLNLSGGSRVDIIEVDGVIEVRLAPQPVAVDRAGKLPRLRAAADTPPLTVDDVRGLLDETRR
jgi:AbrB family looped-hinge helix DNA binding protein